MHEPSRPPTEQAERVRTFVEECRARRIPDEVAEAAARYLLGGASSADFADAYWAMRAPGSEHSRVDEGRVVGEFLLQALSPAERDLDALDRRVLDLCVAVDAVTVRAFLHALGGEERVQAACEYAVGRCYITEGDLWRYLQRPSGYTWPWFPEVDADGDPDAASALLLRMLTARLPEIWSKGDESDHVRIAGALRLLGSPYAEMITPQMLDDLRDEVERDWSTLGPCGRAAIELFECDPARYEGWLRRRAEMPPDGRRRQDSWGRIGVLKRLIEYDVAKHLDLAAAFAREPVSPGRHPDIQLQSTGLMLAFRGDPATYHSLLADTLLGSCDALRRVALGLALSAGDARWTRACFRRYIAELKRGGPQIYRAPTEMDARARAALGTSARGARLHLLALPWLLNSDDETLADRIAYALMLLTHSNHEVRDATASWLALRGDAAVDALAPILRGHTIGGRLAAARALAQIGGERVHTLLRDQLARERSGEVRQIILAALAASGGAQAGATAAETDGTRDGSGADADVGEGDAREIDAR